MLLGVRLSPEATGLVQRQPGGHGVHLVWHGRGANLPCHSLLLEVPKADVTPDIPVKVQQYGVEAHHHPKQLSNVVMWLYLQHIQQPPDTIFM